MLWLLFLSGGLSLCAANALGTRIVEAQNRIKESYNIKPKEEKLTKAKEIFEIIINGLLLFTPGVNIAALIFACYSDEKDFDYFVKRNISKNNILEDKKTGEIFEPKKNRFSKKNIFKKIKAKKIEKPKTSKTKELLTKLKDKLKPNKSSELIAELKNKINETPKEEIKPINSEKLIDELKDKLNETQEETKPFIRTALQPEGQLPFEVIWENDHVYSGNVRSLKR